MCFENCQLVDPTLIFNACLGGRETFAIGLWPCIASLENAVAGEVCGLGACSLLLIFR